MERGSSSYPLSDWADYEETASGANASVGNPRIASISDGSTLAGGVVDRSFILSLLWNEISPHCLAHVSRGQPMPVWTATDHMYIPLACSRAEVATPQILSTLQSLKSRGADASILRRQLEGHYTHLHDEFHTAPEIACGNWNLAASATLLQGQLSTIFNSDAAFGSFVEAWIFEQRVSGQQETLQLFLTLCNLVGSVACLLRHSTNLVELWRWQSGAASTLCLLTTLAKLSCHLGSRDQPCSSAGAVVMSGQPASSLTRPITSACWSVQEEHVEPSHFSDARSAQPGLQSEDLHSSDQIGCPLEWFIEKDVDHLDFLSKDG